MCTPLTSCLPPVLLMFKAYWIVILHVSHIGLFSIHIFIKSPSQAYTPSYLDVIALQLISLNSFLPFSKLLTDAECFFFFFFGTTV